MLLLHASEWEVLAPMLAPSTTTHSRALIVDGQTVHWLQLVAWEAGLTALKDSLSEGSLRGQEQLASNGGLLETQVSRAAEPR
jgi:hypothetical protein